ncbi:MAG: hypothetical protein ISS55_06700 [Dehalococcoidales bacterium]|nr:hypothetical protein [Dehalococcoidales bacterium]
MLESKRHRLAKRMKWAARIIGLVMAGLFLVVLIGEAAGEFLDEGKETIETAGILLGVLLGLALLGTIVSWWRERLASMLLAAASVGLGIHIAVYAGRNHFFAWLMVGLPYLVAGILFLISSRLSRQDP